MILLSTYSISWCQNNDSLVLIPISAIKVANCKMIELKYEKEINNNLVKAIEQDSIIIECLENEIKFIEEEYSIELDKVKKQRNKAITIGSSTSVVLFILFILAL